jgi:CheY-like chemotaxis protein
VAYDGLQALAVIEQERPSLVLLDLMVPKMAGDQILARMRSTDWGKDIKVHIISNLNESDAPAGLRDLGIEGYSVKANLANDQLDQLVAKILTPPADAQTVAPSTPANSIDATSAQPTASPQDPTDTATPQY